LAPPKPLLPSRGGHTDNEWIARIEAWQVNPASWNLEEDGPAPNDPNHRIPLDIVGRLKDRQKREREKAAADAALLEKLLAATGGNANRGPGIKDVAPIKMAMELVPLDCILSAIRGKTDRKCYPKNEPATSWRDPRLLKAIAESYCRSVLVPSMVAGWSAAGRAPQKPADASEASPLVQVPPAPESAPATSPAHSAAIPNGDALSGQAPVSRARRR
jgi:hypothetical protein